jgi:hypothetical protein
MIKTEKKVHLHGDLTLYPVEKITGMAKAEKKSLHVLQSSGTTGNRHEIVSANGKDKLFRWNADGKEYVHGNKAFVLQHVGGDEEHGKQDIESGTYEVVREKEYDVFKEELKIVVD